MNNKYQLVSEIISETLNPLSRQLTVSGRRLGGLAATHLPELHNQKEPSKHILKLMKRHEKAFKKRYGKNLSDEKTHKMLRAVRAHALFRHGAELPEKM